ncbi:hypothetical protein [Paenibacillus sp. NPDC058174]|uniref:hypothetical protein n=1 Tax=Paenibacillus sp. NPDC058174 TaxID=3346366 RepID=UPI0036D85DCD
MKKDQRNDIKSPSVHRSEVVEKRMEMLATLLDKLNEEAIAEQRLQKEKAESTKWKGRNKRRFMRAVVGIFFHRVE